MMLILKRFYLFLHLKMSGNWLAS